MLWASQFFFSNNPKPNEIEYIMISNGEKLKIVTGKRLETGNLLHSRLIIGLHDDSVIKITVTLYAEVSLNASLARFSEQFGHKNIFFS